MQDAGKVEETPSTAPAEPSEIKQAWNVVFFKEFFMWSYGR